jgi:hypothetical protein
MRVGGREALPRATDRVPGLIAGPAIEGLAGGGEELARRAEIIGLEVDDASVILILGW